MKKLLAMVIALAVMGSGVAVAHQPVVLLNSDTTAAKGPLLVDGTVSFAVRAAFNKAGEKKAFRAQFKEGDALEVQYLIVDKKPENALKSNQLPSVVITGPGGFRLTMKINERSKFFEPYGKTNYLYLARNSEVAKAGIYNFVITARAKSAITVAVGEKEIPGEVVRGAYVAPRSVRLQLQLQHQHRLQLQHQHRLQLRHQHRPQHRHRHQLQPQRLPVTQWRRYAPIILRVVVGLQLTALCMT
jgi:hypothetical protein